MTPFRDPPNVGTQVRFWALTKDYSLQTRWRPSMRSTRPERRLVESPPACTCFRERLAGSDAPAIRPQTRAQAATGIRIRRSRHAAFPESVRLTCEAPPVGRLPLT